MDPGTLADTAVSFLHAYLQRIGGLVADRAAQTIADGVLPLASRLHRVLRRALRGTDHEAALDATEDSPEAPPAADLVTAVREVVEADPATAAELADILREAGWLDAPAAGIGHVEGAAAVGGNVTIRGRYAAGRDVVVRADPEETRDR
ncbi:hypothetical protein [Actinocatenispora rupis]|uniref:Uncharacterized protein n=1 Tax=Actinocatenispora rupis TaxID=519421 RepID=A0A8J3N9G5_9ACTN|nr:hypothetical protein [Actinocatenispora rupis]GID11299.1 hypothetical protein Aru02nite_21880 [Actinocatenispora rupis]